MLTREEFDILSRLAQDNDQCVMNTECAKKLIIVGYIDNDGKVTESGLAALEPYRVQRACFLAAGFGQRLNPVTINTPKPMVNVNGKRIIETLLDAVIAAGIQEIYIAVGYLEEQFELLKSKYPMITLLHNTSYRTTNNISSALLFGERIRNSYIIESDLFLSNPRLIRRYQYESNYLGIPMKHTDDYCIFAKDGYIDRVGIGGDNCYQIVGITYWTDTDGARLAKQIEKVFSLPEGKQLFFGSVATRYYLSDYKIGVRECAQEDVVEIDSFSELQKIDQRYMIPGNV